MKQFTQTLSYIDRYIFSRFWFLYIKLLDIYSRISNKEKDAPTSQFYKDIETIPERDTVHKWDIFINNFRKEIKEKNINTFLNWETIVGTMFCEPNIYELFYLKSHKKWTAWKMLSKEHPFGTPKPWLPLLSSSGNRIHHLYHLAHFEDVSGKNFSDYDTIIELGGGYGSMARLIYNSGFTGEYIIHDFPEFNSLQNLYLEETREEGAVENIRFTSNIDDLDTIRADAKILFIAMWSLSETPVEFRDTFLKKINSFVDTYYIAYQKNFSGTDNVEYFKKLTGTLPKLKWIAHPTLPNKNSESTYLIGGK